MCFLYITTDIQHINSGVHKLLCVFISNTAVPTNLRVRMMVPNIINFTQETQVGMTTVPA